MAPAHPPPLAPRNAFEIWAAAVVLLCRHPLQFVGSAVVLTLAGDLVTRLWGAAIATLVAAPGTTQGQLVQAWVLSFLLALAVLLAVFALTGALQAILVVQALTAEPVTIRAALRLLVRRLRPVVGATALLALVPQLVVLGLIATLGAYLWHELGTMIDGGGPADPALAPGFPLPDTFLFLMTHIWQIVALPLLVWLMVALALLFAPVTAALEPLGLGGALRRSAVLVGNNLLRVVGMLLLELLATVAVGLTFLLPASLAAGVVLTWLISQIPAAADDVTRWVDVVMYVPGSVVTAAYYAWLVAVLVLLYVDVRVRKEGLAADLRERRAA